ncbi:MAG: YwaF family protein [Clostridia bacterium]|nr:YwaF family protein [Clostridia bacterium]
MHTILGSNNPLFGLKHLLFVGISAVCIALLFLFVRKKSFKTLCAILFYGGLLSELIKIFYFSHINADEMGGILPKTDLPFHLCSIQLIFIAILYLYKNEKLHRFLLSFMRPSCLFGGIAAILIATDSSRNGGWIITTQYFGYHVLLVVFSLYLFTNKEMQFNVKDYFNCLKFLLVLMFFAFYINSMLYEVGGEVDVNFMYVISPPQPGLPYLNEKQGWFVYVLKYALLILVCITLSYILPIVKAIKEKLAKKDEPLPEPTEEN